MSHFDGFADHYKDVLDQSLALSGETGEYFAEYKARYVCDQVVGPGFSGRVLDFGCGIGLLSGCLKAQLPLAAIHGFDVSGKSIRRIHANLRAAGVFTTDEAELAAQYDVIVLSNVLHHVTSSARQAMMRAIGERLAKGGRLVVFEHNPLNPVTRWIVKRSGLDEDAVLVPRRETAALLAAAGMRVVRRSYIVFFPRPLAWLRRLERFLSPCPLGAQYAVVGTLQ
ncbi:MAG TPA: class I SAM-dependent methyltransferase [Nitrospiraceae bacterium]|jgi:2-polyprenyl-3-methyl-5-hydroxy-6-metoxy-1,4-benzoquinol methylase|nr:class I SAM-dependent methyltransferase [Nitrospiraceae bacterium]